MTLLTGVEEAKGPDLPRLASDPRRGKRLGLFTEGRGLGSSLLKTKNQNKDYDKSKTKRGPTPSPLSFTF